MNLARRLMPLMTHIANPQNWSFVSSDWTISSSNKRARFDSLSAGYVAATWKNAAGDVGKSTTNGKFYFEVKVNALNVSNSNGPRIGLRNKSNGNTYFFVPRGALTLGDGSFIAYMGGTTGSNTVYKWNQGDIIGCSIEATASNTVIRFYLNGLDLGIAWTLLNQDEYEPLFGGYLTTSSNYIELSISDYKHKPSGFSAWE